MTERSAITLYSGGHRGAEAEFGRQAEKWGLNEVNFFIRRPPGRA